MPLIEVRPFTELEMSDRGISGTDVAIAVAVDGKVVGFCNDYGTFEPFQRDDIKVDKDEIESLVSAAAFVWSTAGL